MDDRRLKALEDVVRAWLEGGSDPSYVQQQRDTVRKAMPTLADSLDKLVVELKSTGRSA